MSGSAPSIALTQVGKKITFRTKNTTDQTLWEGRLEGLVTAVIAQNFSDIVSYNAAVRLTDTTVSSDVTTLTFFLITLDGNGGPVQRYAFAEEWVLPGTFAIIDQQTLVNVVVYDSPTGDHTLILAALRAAGYTCYIESTTTP